MKLSPHWLRDFVDFKVDARRLADDLTLAGVAVETIDGEGDRTIFEMEIGTNRPDAMNHYGVAREISALYDLPLKAITPKLPVAKGSANFKIEIEEPELCPRFTAQVMRGITVRPSPCAIAQRLTLIDQRPISNTVDASNYVLWEIGKPTHAFDLDLLEGGKIVVRKARTGEILKTLDGIERKLTAEDLVVADAKKPVALAGVMGGFDTMITEKTKNVLIESAWWDPVTIRKMSRRHGLHTDASHRFERGADYDSCPLSCECVAELILASGGGELVGGVIDVIARPMPRPIVTLRLAEVKRHLGKELSRDEVQRILTRLGFRLQASGDAFQVQVPSWRLDVEREIDLIEEIARLHGYNQFPNTLPAFSGSVVELPDAAKDGRLRSTLLALGYNEAMSLTFISKDDAQAFSTAEALEIANPLSDELAAMRSSLIPGMLGMLAWNLNRGSDNVALFESGHVFENAGNRSVERKCIAIGATGNVGKASVHQAARPYSFFDLKGDIETLLGAFSSNAAYYDAHAADYFHPGRRARAVIDGQMVAQFGQIYPDVAAARKIKQDVYVAEIYLDRLYQHSLRKASYAPLAKFPAVERDFSFVFADAVSFEQIHAAVAGLRLAEMRSFGPVEIFRGGNVGAGKYSILLRATFQSNERTLREEEVAEWSSQIIWALEKLGGMLRA
jgi:phenylalanyl-tRNA synthetase beta chain